MGTRVDTRGRMHQHIEQVALEPHHDRLRLGVAHSAIELDGSRLAARIDHQAGVEKAGKQNAVLRHAGDGRVNDFVHHSGVHVRRHDRRGRVSAHAAGVRAFVVVEQALVILARRERYHVLAVAHHDEAGLFALEKPLDHDAGLPAVVLHAELVVVGAQHPVDRLVRLRQAHRDDHALAGRQAVGLDDDR